ncbi:MAG: amidohydrolase family protein [Myxococcota bacterium]
MTTFDPRALERIRAGLDHPIIDGDGHIIEFMPAVREQIVRLGGESAAEVIDGFLAAPKLARTLDLETRRALGMYRMSWWALPAENTLDRATSMLPSLLDERLPELGIDFALVYPTLGLMITAIEDADARRAVCRAFNHYYADAFASHRERLAPVAVIPMHTPEEAVEELEYAHGLGLRAAVLEGHVHRPLPGKNESRVARWIDSFGPDEPDAYDAVWQRCLDLGISPTFHSSGMGWPSRASLTSYVFNHLGNFAVAGETTCRSLFLAGVPHRFPTLPFAFLEGGAAWGANLYSDMLGHFEKRGAHALGGLDPSRIDRGEMKALFEKHAPEAFRRHLDRLGEGLAVLSDPEEDPATLDEFRHAAIEKPEDVRRVFADQFYFGCEADDPMNALAFDTKTNPLGARLQAIFSSDIGHWDVPDMRCVLLEAHEAVDDGNMSPEDFRRFTFSNAASLFTATNPDFFAGTAVESAVARELA